MAPQLSSLPPVHTRFTLSLTAHRSSFSLVISTTGCLAFTVSTAEDDSRGPCRTLRCLWSTAVAVMSSFCSCCIIIWCNTC